VKLNGHGKPTVALYARPDFAAPLAGMGISGEVLDKLSCRDSGSSTWCRVGYRNQPGRELWAPPVLSSFWVTASSSSLAGEHQLTPH